MMKLGHHHDGRLEVTVMMTLTSELLMIITPCSLYNAILLAIIVNISCCVLLLFTVVYVCIYVALGSS